MFEIHFLSDPPPHPPRSTLLFLLLLRLSPWILFSPLPPTLWSWTWSLCLRWCESLVDCPSWWVVIPGFPCQFTVIVPCPPPLPAPQSLGRVIGKEWAKLNFQVQRHLYSWLMGPNVQTPSFMPWFLHSTLYLKQELWGKRDWGRYPSQQSVNLTM